MTVTLAEVLAARDRRAAIQRELLGQYGKPLLCLTMNIPGEEKVFPAVERAFDAGCAAIRETVGGALVCERILRENTGCEAFFVCDLPAAELKRRAVAIEEAKPVGRLYDMDVLDERGEKLSRGEMRKCIVCGGPVSVCSRSRAHGLPALEAKVRELLADFE